MAKIKKSDVISSARANAAPEGKMLYVTLTLKKTILYEDAEQFDNVLYSLKGDQILDCSLELRDR